jgi:DNA-binding NarL/FixJ family response regulator
LSALASKAGPDIILLDIQMGDACGLDAIRPIKALSRSTQVLMLTTFFDVDQKKKALSAGASGFLLKRFPIEQILDSIQEASKNPVPHLKRSRGESREAGREQESAPACRPQRRKPWFKQALNMMSLRHN